MWSPSQLSRTQSNHSVALSIASMTSSASSQNSLYSHHAASSTPDTHYSGHDVHEQHPEHERVRDSILASFQHQSEKEQGLVQSPLQQTQQLQPVAFNLDEVMPEFWSANKKKTLMLNSKEHFLVAAKQHKELRHSLEMQRQNSDSSGSDDTHATLAEEQQDGLHEGDMDLKTPTVPRRHKSDDADTVFQPSGPMSQLLHSLLMRVADVERAQPTIMAEQYDAVQARLSELERENKSMLQSHNDLLALRNDDLLNLIKVRNLLAEERREHAAIRQLRDDDLENVLMLRDKLAKDTWSGKLQISTSQQQERRGGGSATPIQSYAANRNSKSDSDDLWQQAKKAALEQRVLELEKANAELKAAAVAGRPTPAAATSGGELLTRVEHMFEDSLKQREKMASKVQQLRSEKEVLQKELAGLEDRNGELEVLVERLKRGFSVSAGQ